MLKIRLQRSGRKKRPNYRIVVAEHSAPIKGRYVDIVGTFDPLVEKHGLVVDIAKVEEWIKKGAKPTNTVARLLKGKGEKNMDGFIVEMKDRTVKNPKEVKEKPAAPAAEAPVVEEKKKEEVPAEEATSAVEEEKKEEAPAETPTEDIPQDDQGGSGEAKKDDTEPEKPAEEKKEAPAEKEKKEEESA